jgi:hypothetical protein
VFGLFRLSISWVSVGLWEYFIFSRLFIIFLSVSIALRVSTNERQSHISTQMSYLRAESNLLLLLQIRSVVSFLYYDYTIRIETVWYVLLHVYPLLGNGLVKKFPRRQILGKQSVARSRNNKTNAYSSLLGNNQRANGLAGYLSRDLFWVWSAPCPVLRNKSVNTFTIIGVFYRGPCRRFIEDSPGWFSSWKYKDENGACPYWIVKISWVQIRTEEYGVIEDEITRRLHSDL